MKLLFIISFLDDYDKARNLHPPFAAIILRPALAMTLNDPQKFSAAEFLLYSHFFSISNPMVRQTARL